MNWQCKECSIENEQSSSRCTSCGTRRFASPDADVSNEHITTLIKEEDRELVSSINDQKGVPYKTSTEIPKSNVFEHHS
jgi:predicted ATP-dependent serine protease